MTENDVSSDAKPVLEVSGETTVVWGSLFRNWAIADMTLGFLILVISKSRGAEFYLLNFIAVLFLAALPLVVTVGAYSIGTSKVAIGSTRDGNMLQVSGVVLSALVFLFFIWQSVI
jgi:hypothetical protein